MRRVTPTTAILLMLALLAFVGGPASAQDKGEDKADKAPCLPGPEMKPDRYDERHIAWPQRAGCKLAPVGTDKGVVETIEIVEVVIGKGKGEKTTIKFVLLDKDKNRVIADGERVRYRVELKRKTKGRVKLEDTMRKDGIYTLTLPGNAPAKPCETHILLYFDNGAKVLEHWTDDWLHGC